MIKDLLSELSQAESEKESKLKSILQRLIERFCDSHIKWRQFISTVAGNSIVLTWVLEVFQCFWSSQDCLFRYISCLRIGCYFAELDVLISLSIVSDYYDGRSCRPVIASSNPDEMPFLKAKSLGHPVLRSDTLGEGTFVTNDVTLGGANDSSFILLTGPNMGGKSTLLRQVCLAVILAQVCFWISFLM